MKSHITTQLTDDQFYQIRDDIKRNIEISTISAKDIWTTEDIQKITGFPRAWITTHLGHLGMGSDRKKIYSAKKVMEFIERKL